MSDYSFNISVQGGKIFATEDMLTADSVEYVSAEFTFDDSWTNLLKTAVFRVGELVYALPLEEDKCFIPFEALREGILYISVFGVRGSTRATTAELPVRVQASGYTVCEPEAPAADPYSYFLEKVTELKEEAAAAAESAVSSGEDALASKNIIAEILSNVQKAEENVISLSELTASSKEKAEAAANEACSYAESAKELTENAKTYADSANKAADTATGVTLSEIEAHNSADNSSAHPNLIELAREAKQIALGKATSLSFNTKEELDLFIAGEFIREDGITVEDLKVGDNLYIVELGVPDYWWDGTTLQPLGAETPNLTDYYTKQQIDSKLSDVTFKQMSSDEYATAYTEGSLEAGCIYFVYEED